MIPNMSAMDGSSPSSSPNVPNDYAIYASSVRLPFLAAGLVNSAVAVLLSHLSNQFFQMAIITNDANRELKTVEHENDGDDETDKRRGGEQDKGDGQDGESRRIIAHDHSDNNNNNNNIEQIGQNFQTDVNNYNGVSTQQSHYLSITPNTFLNSTQHQQQQQQQQQHLFSQIECPNFQHSPSSQTEIVKVKQESETELFNYINPQLIQSPTNLFSPDPTNLARVTTVNYLKRHGCNYPGCGKVFFSRTSLLYHKQSHAVDKPYRCPHPGCNLNFSSEAILKTHSQLHDNKLVREKFPCTLPGCNKLFSNRECLIEHIRIHTGERPFACDFSGCSHRFARRCNLFAHKRVHLDKNQRRQYHCIHPGCGKTFLYARSLTEHMNVHLGERPYVCDYPNCNRSFTSKSYLYAHRRIHLGVSRSTTSTTTNRNYDHSAGNMPPIPVTVTVPITQAFPYPFAANFPNKSIPGSSITSPPSVASSSTTSRTTSQFYYNQPN